MKNTAKFQLNHFFKNTPSSVFNQFKHFLALSLLITFSFNAFSVDDSQQFNKEAYLDLSKPYKQKNPQSATKKDNQATTILKEVAGTARTALGSTNSGNTDQLGNKITKGVSNQLKNKAINKTEGFVNNKANTFLNAFGAGRSEVSIGGLSSKKLNYSLRTIQPISELDANSKALTFIQASIASGKSIDSRRTTVNLGVGHRLLVEDDMAIAGINVFTDYESKSSHKRLSLGLEYQRANFSVNINKYHIFSDKKLVNSVKERGMSGYDVKLSGQAPYLPWAKIKGTYYHWDTTAGPNIKGNILGVDIELTPSVSFEFGQENNNTINVKSYGKLTVKLPLGNKQKFTNFAIASKAFKDSRKMDLGALAWAERSNKIAKEIIIVQNGGVPPPPPPPTVSVDHTMNGDISVDLKPIKRTTGHQSSAFVGGFNTIGAPTVLIWAYGAYTKFSVILHDKKNDIQYEVHLIANQGKCVNLIIPINSAGTCNGGIPPKKIQINFDKVLNKSLPSGITLSGHFSLKRLQWSSMDTTNIEIHNFKVNWKVPLVN
ncbi:hypothetical protein BSPWISOXPB_5500 [uncultured Gammaproteobacteria bacterium]|nr:hypothetical protein BSPWISOXPB_5500 [uncultured Gammaproteobacteria bacterium]